MPRFVVLLHKTPPGAARPTHWDFMLEADDVLWTWAVETSPDTADPQVASRLADHRLHYLDYEGPISDNLGHVKRWDSGTYSILEHTADRIDAALVGERLKGRVTLTRRNGEPTLWDYQFSADPPSPAG